MHEPFTISDKIILSERELKDILVKTHEDAFEYAKNFNEHWKHTTNSGGNDTYSYVDNLIKLIKKGKVISFKGRTKW